MACVYMKPEVKKKWNNSNDYSYKWILHRMIKWKLLFDGEGVTLLIVENVNLLREIFLVEEQVFFWLLCRILPNSQSFPWLISNISIFNSRGKFQFSDLQGAILHTSFPQPTQVPCLSCTSWYLHKENPDEGAQSTEGYPFISRQEKETSKALVEL